MLGQCGDSAGKGTEGAGTVQGQFKDSSVTVTVQRLLAQCWHSARTVLGECKNSVVTVRGHCRDSAEILQGKCRDSKGIVL